MKKIISRILKIIGLCVLAVVLLVAGGVTWIAVTLSSGPDFDKIQPHHLFKSAKAESRYYAVYDRFAERWPVPSETRYVDTRFGKTFVRISGPKTAPSLLLLPSANSPGLIWFPLAKHLSEHYRVYAVDTLFDSGRSIQMKPVKTTEQVLSWMTDLLDGLGLERPVIAGYSYGGWITARFALARPDRVRKAVLLAPPATIQPFSPDWAIKGLSALLPAKHFMYELSRWMFPVLSARKDGYSRELVRELMNHGYTSMRSFRMRMVPAPDVLSDAEWKSFKIPVLYLAGEKEVVYATDPFPRLAGFPGIKKERIPEAGHDLVFVQTDLVLRNMLEFLGQ